MASIASQDVFFATSWHATTPSNTARCFTDKVDFSSLVKSVSSENRPTLVFCNASSNKFSHERSSPLRGLAGELLSVARGLILERCDDIRELTLEPLGEEPETSLDLDKARGGGGGGRRGESEVDREPLPESTFGGEAETATFLVLGDADLMLRDTDLQLLVELSDMAFLALSLSRTASRGPETAATAAASCR